MVIQALGIVYGGTSKIVIELSEALGKLGISIDIVSTNANGKTLLDVPLNQWITKTYCRVQYFSYLDFLDYKFSLPMSQWLLTHVHDYDVVHTHGIFSFPVLAAYWMCRLHKIPYIVTPHGMLEPWALAYKSWKKDAYFSFLEKPSLQKASAIQMTASSEVKQIHKLKLNTKPIFVPNGIHGGDFASFPNSEIFYHQFPETQNKTLILFLGRIDPKKGLDLLAPAFAQVTQNFSDTHLIIAGPDNTGFLPKAENYFIEAGCRESVTFTGMLTGELKYAALAAAQIYVAPSYSEGFSMSVLEGMASGLPCIITTGCNFPEAKANQAALEVEINTQAIADGLLWCLNHPEEAKQMGEKGRQFIFENYTWDKIAAKLVKAYQSIIDPKERSNFLN